ncbi:MAG: tRNA 4-thiouridine(8) synthase ThiI [Gemmatimonadetes bacterium]|nr:tRNA 4-thiouridine(8) synthase ThiI [Gemmatimonadota bacterium]
MRHLTLIRYDEIGLKGRNRRFFERRLRENVARALEIPRADVAWERGRLFAPGGDPFAPQPASQPLARVFGVRSYSPVLRVDPELEAITPVALALAATGVSRGGRTFAVNARRGDKRFPLTSLELNVALGRSVQQAHPGLDVDLGRPDFTLHVEVRESGAYLFEAVLPGPGGLPVGTAGRALLLLSGGIDSPVAGWLSMKRGLALHAVHFHSFPYTAQGAREKALALAEGLAGWGSGSVRLHLLSATELLQEIGRLAPEGLWTILLRRGMLRVSEMLAARQGCGALVTGDSLGQVASQTLENMAAAEAAVSIPVLRPLVGFDKAEIVELARRIGTYDISVRPFDDCCALFAPRRPDTRARLAQLERAESKMDLERILGRALAEAETVELGRSSRRRFLEPAEELAAV